VFIKTILTRRTDSIIIQIVMITNMKIIQLIYGHLLIVKDDIRGVLPWKY